MTHRGVSHRWQNNAPSRTAATPLQPTSGWDPALAARFGRDVRAPLESNEVTWLDKFDLDPRPLPATGSALLEVGLPVDLVATVHGAGDGHDLVVRVQETAGRPASASIRHPGGADGEAWRCDATEDPQEQLPVGGDGVVTVDLTPHEVVTVRLRGGAGAKDVRSR